VPTQVAGATPGPPPGALPAAAHCSGARAVQPRARSPRQRGHDGIASVQAAV